MVHPADRERIRQAAEEVMRDEQARMVELRIRHKDGTWRHLEAHGGLLRNSSGKAEGFTVSARVVDERILAEQNLRAAHA